MRKTFIIAVSGGVDSVSLLHKLMSVKPDSINYVIAHFDHGVREDSVKDAEFVKKLANKYDATYESSRLELGKNASEETARDERYKFLFSVMKKYKAESIITAHNQDDVIETMIINLLRGTGPRGLIGFSKSHILRPFIHKTKAEIIKYAKDNSLDWREDSTNSDPKYLRNNIRINLIPKISKNHRQDLLKIRSDIDETYRELDLLTKKLLVQTMYKGELVRSRFVILPYKVQLELVAVWFRLENVEIDKKLVERSVLSIKTFFPDKKFEISKSAYLLMTKKTIILKKVHSAPV